VLLGTGSWCWAQFTPEEVAQRDELERFLRSASIVRSERMNVEQGSTQPYKLALADRDADRHALWKDPHGEAGPTREHWRHEIAAYRLDKYLGLHMIPPTVEREVRMTRGACQLWVDAWTNLGEARARGLGPPPERLAGWQRAVSLQRAFDDLIGNEHRSPQDVLVTEDWRMILVDHTGAFATGKRRVKRPVFALGDPDDPEPPALPRSFVERLEALDEPALTELVGDYLTGREIRAVVARRSLVLGEVRRLIAEHGEERVLY
jgi:hypothetical protein